MRWYPDTCKCVINYEFDNSVNPPIILSSTPIEICPTHSIHPSDKVHDVVLFENQTKNEILGKIIETVPSLAVDVVDNGVVVGKQLNPIYDYKWTFDAERNISIDIIGATPQEVQDAKNAADILVQSKPSPIVKVP